MTDVEKNKYNEKRHILIDALLKEGKKFDCLVQHDAIEAIRYSNDPVKMLKAKNSLARAEGREEMSEVAINLVNMYWPVE
jgi:hypothetical protein